MTTANEEWRPIPGFEGVYSVSDQGRVRRDLGVPGTRKGYILKGSPGHRGHLALTLSKDGIPYSKLVHRLVLEAFVGPCPEGLEACHFPNPDPSDNRLTNLRWDTVSANRRDSVIHGTHRSTSKTHCLNGHLLIVPNLKPSGLRKNQRHCLACGRENSLSWMQKRPFDPERADKNYEKIMEGIAFE